ncbi:MAG: uridine phosphorylase, partial [Bacteroidetes bacterium SW_11_45_7]
DQPSTIRQPVYESLGTARNAMWLNGKSWTTDAPYRETETAIEAMTNEGVMCVEMEAAALYAFAHARNRDVACFAHLTNTMAQEEGDFEKGQHFGSLITLELIEAVFQEKN